MFSRKAVEQAHKLRQEKVDERQRLKDEKALSWKQKVTGCRGRSAPPLKQVTLAPVLLLGGTQCPVRWESVKFAA